jgi:CRISPR-associated endonuclease/helicase Cas3
MMPTAETFDAQFAALTGFRPFRWQRRLFRRFVEEDVPSALDIPTGLGKTSVMTLWLIAKACGATLPCRLVYVVDRRAVVDQATTEAEKLRDGIERVPEIKTALGLDDRRLPISTLRGQFVDNREWLADPAAPAIVVGTVDMVGSRLLFSGYGVSAKMRPYHAGLLGTDALIVLDEAHLVPPFAHLLRAIEQDASLWPGDEIDRELLPRFALLPLSATQRDPDRKELGRPPFRLDEVDWKTDRIAKKRLWARKRLWLKPLAQKEQDRQLAATAWALATKEDKFSRVVVFCNQREKGDEGGGPSAQGVKEEIQRLAGEDKRTRRLGVEIHPPELLVGARRVYERDGVAKRLRELGFIGEKKPSEKPAFLVATSAGEVGVDIDADHMISDLVAWERMVQRLGRVNRRGEGDAEIHVFRSDPTVKNTDEPTQREQRALTVFAAKALIEKLPQTDGAFDASPAALRALAESPQNEEALKALIEAATTPELLRPALNRALVDAWSMTSLETHTGRPDVAPWLRGWEEERPQTTIIWRTLLPVRVDIRGYAVPPVKSEVDAFFEAAPPRQSEMLETESYRVASWLQERGSALLKHERRAPVEGEGEGEDSDSNGFAADDIQVEGPTDQSATKAPKLRYPEIAALVLSSSGAYAGYHSLGDLARERKGIAIRDFQGELAGKILILDARFGGLKDGLLDPCSDDPLETADSSVRWSQEAQFRVRRILSECEAQEDGWRFEDDFVLRRDGEGARLEWLVIEHFKDAAQQEDARSISAKAQELGEHQSWAEEKAKEIAAAVGLSGNAAKALALAASLHDEGKKAPRWQRAFKAHRDAQRFDLAIPLAKTRGPIDQAILGGYRHEFGSLPYVEKSSEFKALPDDFRELVLHLVAAHHGQARPVIETRGCEDGPPSLLEERALAAALRFTRLQKRWGPWGLAWWEALLRAADQQASRRLEKS